MMELILIISLVITNLALLGALAYMVSRRKDPDVEVVRQMLNTLVQAFWDGMGVKKVTPEAAPFPPQMQKPLKDEIAYDPEEELQDSLPDEIDAMNEPVDVTGASEVK